MWIAFVSIVASLFLVLLGVIISIHTEYIQRHKILMYASFTVLAVISVGATLEQTRESAVAGQHLEDNFNTLSGATSEISRLTNLNTSLQEQLVAQSKQLISQSNAIRDVAKNSLNNITGGDSYPRIAPQPAQNDQAIPLALWDEGKYILSGVTVTVLDQNELDAKPEYSLRTVQQENVGVVHPGWPRMLSMMLTPKLNDKGIAGYEFEIYTQSGLFTEMIKVRKGADGWWAHTKWGSKQLFDADAVSYSRKHFKNFKAPNNGHMSVSVPLFSTPWSDDKKDSKH